LRLGFTEEAESFIGFLSSHVPLSDDGDTGPLQIMYGSDGRGDLPGEGLDHLAGYPGSAPVRIGDAAGDQLQHDLCGARIAATCPRRSSIIWSAIGAPRRYGSATPPPTSSSSTSTGRSSAPSTSTTRGATRSPATTGTSSAPWSTGCACTGTSPTRASGRPAAAARTSCTRG